MLIVGAIWLIKNRKGKEDKQTSSSFDWNLLYLILLIGITGVVAQVFRIGGDYVPAQVTYVLHLVFVAQIFDFALHRSLRTCSTGRPRWPRKAHRATSLPLLYVASAAPAAVTETEAA
jgi:nitrate reductase gamma subunit